MPGTPGPARRDRPVRVAVVPGMGATGYLHRFADTVTALGTPCTVLDVPGFGRPGPLACPPTVRGVGRAVADLLGHPGEDGDVVLVGHSTGAQAALVAALALQATPAAPVRLVLAGPTVPPTLRSVPRMLLAAPAAYRRDSPRELVVVPQYLRAHRRAVTLLRSGVRDRPENALPRLRLPLVLAAGLADAFCPPWWLHVLARAAVRAPSVTTRLLPGSHNMPFTHPADLAAAVLAPLPAAAVRARA
jgi:pimeloyl-ACP methyl ester carboxylesterase